MGKFCVNCGTALEDNENFCHSCGANQQGSAANYNTNYGRDGNYVGAYKKKSEGIALVLSLLIPGIGQMYNGKLGAGLALLLVSILLGVVAYFLIFLTLIASPNYDAIGAILILCVFVVLDLVVWIYAMYDAYKGAIHYNEVLVQSGHPPW